MVGRAGGRGKVRGCSAGMRGERRGKGWPRRSSSSRRWPRPRHARHAAVCLPGEEDKGEWAGPGKLGLRLWATGKHFYFFSFYLFCKFVCPLNKIVRAFK